MNLEAAGVWSRMRRLLAITAILTLAGAGAATAAPAPWIGPLDLSQPASGAATGCGFANCPGIGAGDLALTPQGDLVAAWTRRDATGLYRVEASTRAAGGTFSAPREVGLASLDADPFDGLHQIPSPVEVEVADDGTPVIAWIGTVNGKRVVQAAVGTGAAVNVSGLGQDARTVKLAMNGAGEAVAVWTRSNGTDFIAQAAIRPAGGAFGAAQDLSVTGKTALNPDVAIDPRGNAVAVWANNATGLSVIQAATRAANANFTAPAAALNLSAAGADAKAPDVALDAQGRATAIWQRGNSIQSAARNTGGAFGTVEDLGATNFVNARPQVAVDGANAAVAVWLNKNLVQSASRPSGASFGDVQDVSAPGAAGNIGPQVAVDAAGSARAIWIGNAATGSVDTALRPPGRQFGGVDSLLAADSFGNTPRLDVDELGNAAAIFPRNPLAKADGFTAQLAAFDGSSPVLRDVSVTPTGVSAAPFDVWSPVTTTWDFGDGTSGAGETLAHAFAPGSFTVTARARDQFGHEAVATRPLTIAAAPPVIQPAAPAPPPVVVPAPPRALSNLVGNNWDVRDTRFKLTLLVVRAPIPAGAVATVACTGKGCPFKTKRSTKIKKGEINLLPLLSKKQRALKAGMTIEVRLTAPGVKGRAVKFVLKRNKVPKPQARAL